MTAEADRIDRVVPRQDPARATVAGALMTTAAGSWSTIGNGTEAHASSVAGRRTRAGIASLSTTEHASNRA